MNSEVVFLLLFIIATGVAIGTRWLRLPYTVALVLAGLVLGAVHLFPAPELTEGLLFTIFLPGLVFEAAFHIDVREFWSNRKTISGLAVPGVIGSTALTALILTPVVAALGLAQGFGWREALVFGALIAATDPIAVIAIFRELHLPRRLTVLLGGESLLNDGTGIVFFTLSLSLIAGAVVTPGALVLEFLKIVGMGAAIGAAIGFAASELIKRVDDAMVEITLTTVAAYGAFVAADLLGFSGVIATVAAGLLCGNYGARTGMSASTRVATETFWEYIAFALNSIVFLLIGLEVKIQALVHSWLAIVVAYLVVTLGRGLVVFAAWSVMRFTRERFSGRWAGVLGWGGLRGALPMVLALSIPAQVPHREFIVTITFGVVILSILGQGITMAPLLRRLGVARDSGVRGAYEQRTGELIAVNGALEELDRLERVHGAPPAVIEALRGEYRTAQEGTRAKLRALQAQAGELREADTYRVRHRVLLAEKTAALDAYQEGGISRTAYERLLADIDARLLQLESQDPVSPPGGGEDRER